PRAHPNAAGRARLAADPQVPADRAGSPGRTWRRLPVPARAGRAFGALRTRLPGRGQHAVAGPDRVRRAEPGTPRARFSQLFQLFMDSSLWAGARDGEW